MCLCPLRQHTYDIFLSILATIIINSDHMSFHYVFLVRCAQSHCTTWLIKIWLTIKWTFCVFLWEHVSPEFLTWLLTHFQCTRNSWMESNCPCSKKQGPISVAVNYTVVMTVRCVQMWSQQPDGKRPFVIKYHICGIFTSIFLFP
jgi:hypothetical protein